MKLSVNKDENAYPQIAYIHYSHAVFFLGFLISKDNIYKSKMCNQWRIIISFQLKISI